MSDKMHDCPFLFLHFQFKSSFFWISYLVLTRFIKVLFVFNLVLQLQFLIYIFSFMSLFFQFLIYFLGLLVKVLLAFNFITMKVLYFLLFNPNACYFDFLFCSYFFYNNFACFHFNFLIKILKIFITHGKSRVK